MATHSVLTVELDGADVAVEVVRRPTSRRLSLRVDTALGRPRVSAPTGVAAADIATFLVRNKGWLRQRLAKLPTPVPFVEGAKIPLRGVLHRLRHCPGRRGTAWVTPGPTAEAPLDLCVTGG
ncbi:MAG: YgjP-like metallopeptidase domain-containing protein, partial [Pseudomonadota bacterium]|nr:YgjP-like metallopeptidase domain-containing protein [Pseudomonadota bacterium]